MRLYIDTNILVYALEDSVNRLGKDISTTTTELFVDVITCKHNIVISTWTLKELSKVRTLESATALLGFLKKKIIICKYTKEDMQKAKMTEHFHDKLHVILALKSGCDCIVTRNVKDFYRYNIKIKRPEELL